MAASCSNNRCDQINVRINCQEDVDDYVEYIPVAKRRRLVEVSRRKILSQHNGGGKDVEHEITKPSRLSLLAKFVQTKKEEEAEPEKQIVIDHQEKVVIEHLTASDHRMRPLLPVRERAKGITYKESLLTGWKAPLPFRKMSKKARGAIMKQYDIIVDGDGEEEIPPPIMDFKHMRLAGPILEVLKAKGIKKPMPIQVQGMPVMLSGRDMIGISYTGSGKTLAFVLPLIMMSLQEEMTMSIAPGEGPLGLVVCPTRELARQTFEVIEQFLKPLKDYGGYAELRSLLCIGGGSNMKSHIDLVVKRGAHIVVATPGRLKDMLVRKKMSLDHCRCVILDEADRLVDEEHVRDIFDHFRFQRQTVLFSATMPTNVQNFAKSGLVNPVTVNVGGRAGAANRDVIQEVEYVKEGSKMFYLAECLQKTPPPVLVFCENKVDVDDVEEYLLLKGVEVVAIHGGKDEVEREQAISTFKYGKKDVLVATNVVSKGLDFPNNIQHVINYDMPSGIEDYVHRIGRTGRCGKTGIATTFINYKNQNETILLDLKHLLQEANQRIPPVLAKLNDDDHRILKANANVGVGCFRCSGLGHRVVDCPMLARDTRLQMAAASGGKFWGSRTHGEGEM